MGNFLHINLVFIFIFGLSNLAAQERSLKSFKATDGTEIPYLKVAPEGHDSTLARPALIYVDGSDPTDPRQFKELEQLCKNGACVFILGERGVELIGDEGEKEVKVDRSQYPSSISQASEDLVNFVNNVVAQDPSIDQNNICILSHSFGSVATLTALPQIPHIKASFSTGTIMDGVVNSGGYQMANVLGSWLQGADQDQDGIVTKEEFANAPGELEKQIDESFPIFSYLGGSVSNLTTAWFAKHDSLTMDELPQAVGELVPQVMESLALYNPRLFNVVQSDMAMAPVNSIELPKNVQYYFYHGARDPVVPVSPIQKAQEKEEPYKHYKVIADQGHDLLKTSKEIMMEDINKELSESVEN